MNLSPLVFFFMCLRHSNRTSARCESEGVSLLIAGPEKRSLVARRGEIQSSLIGR